MTLITDEMVEKAIAAGEMEWAVYRSDTFKDSLRAALEAIAPAIVETCAKVADKYREGMDKSRRARGSLGHSTIVADCKSDAAATIADLIRDLKTKP